MDIQEVKDRISEIECFNYDNFTNDKYRYILKKMGELIRDEINLILPNYSTNNLKIYRCRSNNTNELFNNARNLWHPPKEKTPTGRLNFEKKPILYTAHNAATAMIEIEAYKYDHITTVEYKVKPEKLKTIEFGLKTISKNERSLMDERTRLIMEFLSREAKKKVSKERFYEYCPTIIFATSVTTNRRFDAFLYESVATNHSGLNFAFKSKFAEENLMPVEFRYIKIFNKINENRFSVKCIARTVNKYFDLDSDLIWTDVNDCSGHNINSEEFSYH